MNKVSSSINNHILSIETGKIAKQASGAVLVQFGETVVLVTVASSKNSNEDISFFISLTYQSKAWASGLCGTSK